MAVVGADHARD